jgi:hypothetical protein
VKENKKPFSLEEEKSKNKKSKKFKKSHCVFLLPREKKKTPKSLEFP